MRFPARSVGFAIPRSRRATIFGSLSEEAITASILKSSRSKLLTTMGESATVTNSAWPLSIPWRARRPLAYSLIVTSNPSFRKNPSVSAIIANADMGSRARAVEAASRCTEQPAIQKNQGNRKRGLYFISRVLHWSGRPTPSGSQRPRR
jgi:hypothetical protein